MSRPKKCILFKGPVLLSSGSSLKFMLLATGKADVCPRFASTTEWDTAAAYAVIKTIGVVVIDKDTKQELTNNKESCVTHGKRI